MSDAKTLLIIPHLIVHNANALSSPITIGFPAMTAWLGAVHALERHCQQKAIDVVFKSVGVVSHSCDVQTYRGDNDFVSSIVGTSNPLGKDGKRPSFIEEPRCHLDVTLVIECELNGYDDERDQALIDTVKNKLHLMKMASGDIQDFNHLQLLGAESPRDLTRYLMPGYALIERRDLMIEAMKSGQDALDALIDHLAVHHASTPVDSEAGASEVQKGQWRSYKKGQNGETSGWLVPIAAGYHGISELSLAKNQRDTNTLHKFAESLITLGEFKMPHRLKRWEEFMWRYQVDESANSYQCTQQPILPTQAQQTSSTTNSFDEM